VAYRHSIAARRLIDSKCSWQRPMPLSTHTRTSRQKYFPGAQAARGLCKLATQTNKTRARLSCARMCQGKGGWSSHLAATPIHEPMRRCRDQCARAIRPKLRGGWRVARAWRGHVQAAVPDSFVLCLSLVLRTPQNQTESTRTTHARAIDNTVSPAHSLSSRAVNSNKEAALTCAPIARTHSVRVGQSLMLSTRAPRWNQGSSVI
jgi:hypothetical protein